jgi:hypothetical protein
MHRFNDESAGARLLRQIAASPLSHAALREDIARLRLGPPATDEESLDLTLATETALARLRREVDRGSESAFLSKRRCCAEVRFADREFVSGMEHRILTDGARDSDRGPVRVGRCRARDRRSAAE